MSVTAESVDDITVMVLTGILRSIDDIQSHLSPKNQKIIDKWMETMLKYVSFEDTTADNRNYLYALATSLIETEGIDEKFIHMLNGIVSGIDYLMEGVTDEP